MANNLVSVKTLAEWNIGGLRNFDPLASPQVANYQFNNFQERTANLGETVQINLPMHSRPVPGYPEPGMTYGSIDQNTMNLTVDEAWTDSWAYSPKERTFNNPDAIDKEKIKLCVRSLGTQISKRAASEVEKNTFRFYSPGITYGTNGSTFNRITSPGELQLMIASFMEYGFIPSDMQFVCDAFTIAYIANTALNQFALNRNNEIAASWNYGKHDGCSIFRSSFLNTHISGLIGNETSAGAPMLLEVASGGIVTGPDGGISQITFKPIGSGTFPTTGPGAKENDVFQFVDNVGSLPNMRYLTEGVGYQVTQVPVQCRVTQDATATSTAITLNFSPSLYYNDGTLGIAFDTLKENISQKIVAGMQIQIMPSHRVGVIMSGKPLFIAAPKIACPNNEYATQKNIRFDSDPVTVTDMDLGPSFTFQMGRQFPSLSTALIGTVQFGATAYGKQMLRVLLPV